MSIIDEDIKSGKLNHIYLIYGAEDFLRKEGKVLSVKQIELEIAFLNFLYILYHIFKILSSAIFR